jgi:UMF1 family MFS transporter
MNGTVYFSQWIVVENHVPDLWFSLTFILSTALLVLIAPYFGVKVDTTGKRKYYLFILTALIVLSGALIEVFGRSVTDRNTRIILTLIAYGALNFFYQLALLVYNTYLKDITEEKFFGKVSGFGGGIGTIGSIIGIIVTLPIVEGMIHLFGTGRINVFIPAAILCLVVSIPMLLISHRHQEKVFPADVDKQKNYFAIWAQIWHDLRNISEYPGVTRMLIAFYFFSDAILTLQLYSAIYLDRILHIDDALKIFIFFLVFGGFSVGAVFGGWLGDKFGQKKIMIQSLVLTALTIFLISFTSKLSIYYILFALFGLANGSVFATVRALFSVMIPYHKKGQFFGLYSLSERFASIIGPAAWGILVFLLPDRGNLNYRVAVFFMGLLILGAVAVLVKLKDPTRA